MNKLSFQNSWDFRKNGRGECKFKGTKEKWKFSLNKLHTLTISNKHIHNLTFLRRRHVFPWCRKLSHSHRNFNVIPWRWLARIRSALILHKSFRGCPFGRFLKSLIDTTSVAVWSWNARECQSLAETETRNKSSDGRYESMCAAHELTRAKPNSSVIIKAWYRCRVCMSKAWHVRKVAQNWKSKNIIVCSEGDSSTLSSKIVISLFSILNHYVTS